MTEEKIYSYWETKENMSQPWSELPGLYVSQMAEAKAYLR